MTEETIYKTAFAYRIKPDGTEVKEAFNWLRGRDEEDEEEREYVTYPEGFDPASSTFGEDSRSECRLWESETQFMVRVSIGLGDHKFYLCSTQREAAALIREFLPLITVARQDLNYHWEMRHAMGHREKDDPFCLFCSRRRDARNVD